MLNWKEELIELFYRFAVVGMRRRKVLEHTNNLNFEYIYSKHFVGLKPTKAEFLYNWLAHDYLHIKQILNLKHDYLKQLSNVSLKYAGDW